MEKRKIGIAALVILIALGIIFFGRSSSRQGSGDTAATSTLSHVSAASGFSIEYPAQLSVSENGARGDYSAVIFSHSVPFRNGGCDARGDAISDTLEDFHASFQVVSKNVRGTALQMSPYIPAENFSETSLLESPGFIDAVTIGTMTGWKIYEGAEGCGRVAYYFPIGENQTLFTEKDLVQEFSGAVAEERRAALLAVPGVLSLEESDRIFSVMIASFRKTQ